MGTMSGCGASHAQSERPATFWASLKRVAKETIRPEDGFLASNGDQLTAALKDLGRTTAGKLLKSVAVTGGVTGGLMALTAAAGSVHPILGGLVGVATLGTAGLIQGRKYAAQAHPEEAGILVGVGLGLLLGMMVGTGRPIPLFSAFLFGAINGGFVGALKWVLDEDAAMEAELRARISSRAPSPAYPSVCPESAGEILTLSAPVSFELPVISQESQTVTSGSQR